MRLGIYREALIMVTNKRANMKLEHRLRELNISQPTNAEKTTEILLCTILYFMDGMGLLVG
jgi:hypothetical protein